MLLTFQGFWTVSLYFGLLGVIWLPRYYIIPTKLRLWPSYWLYRTFSNPLSDSRSATSYPSDKHTALNYTLHIDYHHHHQCFNCDVTLRPTHCSFMFSDVIFPPSRVMTSSSYDVYSGEKYPCYQTVAKQHSPSHLQGGECRVREPQDNAEHFTGTGCLLCSLCKKNAVFNTSRRRTNYRKLSRTPRFSISVSGGKTVKSKNSREIVHCLNKLAHLRVLDKDQFCGSLQEHISVYNEEGHTTVFSGCNNLCSEAVNLVYRELYSIEIGVWLLLLAGVVLGVVSGATCVSYSYSICRELAIVNLPWNSQLLCPICMDKLRRFTRIRTLRCGHTFCRGCLYRWLRVFGHVTCPLCRQPVDPHVQLLSTTDLTPVVIPPLLMITDTPYSEGGDDTESISSENPSSTPHNIVQSIYNIGRNVVSGWSLHNNNSSSISDVQSLSSEPAAPLLGNGENLMLDTETALISDPIPLPYYPLFSSNTSQIVLPYTTSSHIPSPCYPFLDQGGAFQNLVTCSSNRVTCSCRSIQHHHLSSSFDSFSHSDTELLGPSSRLQNRIAKKLNRIKNRRLGTRRTQSTSDLTSVTSHSESENE